MKTHYEAIVEIHRRASEAGASVKTYCHKYMDCDTVPEAITQIENEEKAGVTAAGVLAPALPPLDEQDVIDVLRQDNRELRAAAANVLAIWENFEPRAFVGALTVLKGCLEKANPRPDTNDPKPDHGKAARLAELRRQYQRRGVFGISQIELDELIELMRLEKLAQAKAVNALRASMEAK